MGAHQASRPKVYEKDCGFRIYKIYKKSPLKLLGINELTDFIIPPDELNLYKISFEDWLKDYKNQKIKIKIYSLLTRKMKEIEIELKDIDNKDEILGCEINYENYISAQEKLLHVIKVKKNSFAEENLFLIENQDYIIGLKNLSNGVYNILNNKRFKELINVFSEIISRNKGKECEFYIYNIKKGPKIIMAKIPDKRNFTLGCDVAFGKIHEFPMKSKKGEDEDEEKSSLKG